MFFSNQSLVALGGKLARCAAHETLCADMDVESILSDSLPSLVDDVLELCSESLPSIGNGELECRSTSESGSIPQIDDEDLNMPCDGDDMDTAGDMSRTGTHFDIVEIYSPPRVVEVCTEFSLKAGPSVDILTGYDLLDAETRKKVGVKSNKSENGHLMQHLYGACVVALLSDEIEGAVDVAFRSPRDEGVLDAFFDVSKESQTPQSIEIVSTKEQG